MFLVYSSKGSALNALKRVRINSLTRSDLKLKFTCIGASVPFLLTGLRSFFSLLLLLTRKG